MIRYYMYGVIYKITCKINGKMYIGQTTETNFDVYIKSHFSVALNIKSKQYAKLLSRAIRKHGAENFSYRILCECYSKEDLDAAETHFICNHYRSNKKKVGYNVRNGGARGAWSEEGRKMLSRIHLESYKDNPERARNVGNLKRGTRHREESKKRTSESLKAFYADPIRSAETRECLSRASTGHKMPEHVRRFMSELHKGRVPTKAMKESLARYNAAVAERGYGAGSNYRPLPPEVMQLIRHLVLEGKGVRAISNRLAKMGHKVSTNKIYGEMKKILADKSDDALVRTVD